MKCLKGKYNYGTVYIRPPNDIKEEIVAYGKNLLEYGLVEQERNPHVTVLHGIITNDPEEVAKVVAPFHPIRMMFGASTMFMPNDYTIYDILKINVYGVYIKRLRERLLKGLDNKQTYTSFFPHLTLAALETNYALMYIGTNPFIGRKCVVQELIFSPAEGDKVIIHGDGTISNL